MKTASRLRYEAREREIDNETILATFWIAVFVFTAVGVFGAMLVKQPIVTLVSFMACFLMFFFRVIQIKFG